MQTCPIASRLSVRFGRALDAGYRFGRPDPVSHAEVTSNVILAVAEAAGMPESFTVKEYSLASELAVGLPVIAPVSLFKLKPAGSSGATDH